MKSGPQGIRFYRSRGPKRPKIKFLNQKSNLKDQRWCRIISVNSIMHAYYACMHIMHRHACVCMHMHACMHSMRTRGTRSALTRRRSRAACIWIRVVCICASTHAHCLPACLHTHTACLPTQGGGEGSRWGALCLPAYTRMQASMLEARASQGCYVT